MNIKFILFNFIVFFLPSFALADKPTDSVYLEGDANTALILAHGKGKHPTWLVVNPLRKGVNEQLGYHTLSLQMPTGHAFWQDYAGDFPDAYAAIDNAIQFLRNEKGVKKIFLMGHSMGSRMVSAYVSQQSQHSLSGLIVAGCRNNGGEPLSCEASLIEIDIPVLDIWGGRSGKDTNAAYERQSLLSNHYLQIEIAEANHRFEDYEAELVSATIDWLQKNNKK